MERTKIGKRVIALFTGNRAEYGLQFPILKAIDEHPDLDYQLIVSGAHLDRNFGQTLEEIKADGFRVDAEVKIDMDASSLDANVKAIGSGILAISNTLKDLSPDVVVVYADRFEGFAAMVASTQMNIPTAHIEGGDLTEGGALDDSVRHAMTKLAHLHFSTNQQATNRILGMGEEVWRVQTVGFPAIDLISEGNYASKDEIIDRFGLDLGKPIILFTQHSVTTEFELATNQIEPTLNGLKRLAADGVQIIATYPNNDAGGRAIIEKLVSIDSENHPRFQVHCSLGRFFYHGILALARDSSHRVVCVGNSSSGIKETAVFGCPTINIGSRQDGRLRGQNVLDVGYNADELTSAIHRCLGDEEFRKQCRECDNPYSLGDAGKKVADALAKVPLGQKLIRKQMTLRGETKDGWFR